MRWRDSARPPLLDSQLIREHLARLLGSPQFVRSARLQRFLQFVVERKLAGCDNDIQEYTIGLEVFDRRESFDPRSDAIVRVEARRLRDRLADYYANAGKKEPIRIVLPERGYIPSFEPQRFIRTGGRRAITAVFVLVVVVVLGYFVARRPSGHEPAPAAHEAFEKGLVAWHQRTAEGARRAAEFFQQAIAFDPQYARAHAWLSSSYNQQAIMGDAPAHEIHAKSWEAARKAIELDPHLAEGYHALAANLTFKPDWPGAGKAFRTAIRLAPENAEIHHAFAIVFLAASPERLAEAEAEIRKAVRLKPGDLDNLVILGKILYFRGRFDQAMSVLQETLRIDASYPDCMRNLAAVLVQMGDHDQAIRLLEDAQKLAYLNWGDGLLGYALALSGKQVRARTILANLESHYAAKNVGALAIGTIYVGLQQWTEACEWLNRSWKNREMRARYISVDPIYDPVRERPCVIRLVQEMGLKQFTP